MGIRATMPGPPQKGRKRARSDKDKKVSNGTAKTKQQIRSVERLLRKETLAADFRAAQEQRLSVLKGQLGHQQTANETKATEIAMSAKYKQAKFFEKQKVTRRLAQLSKKDEPNAAESSELQLCQRNMFYIKNYPRDQPYISLFLPEERDTDEVKAKREAMRATIDAAHNKLHHSKHAVDEEEVEEDDFFLAVADDAEEEAVEEDTP